MDQFDVQSAAPWLDRKRVKKMRFTGIALSIVGILAIASSAVWITTIFPRYEKIPSNFSSVEEFEGSYTVVDPIVDQIQANPVIQQLIYDSTVPELLVDPEIRAFLGHPAVSQQLAVNLGNSTPAVNLEVQAMLAKPKIQNLLAVPSVQQLLSDPAALQLVTDPRTLTLMADPTSLPLIQVPVLIHRDWTATDSDSNRIYLNQRVNTVRTDTGQGLEGFPVTDLNLVVDRTSKVYLEGTEDGRKGGLSFPFGVEKDKVYPLWVSAASQPLEARYVSTEKLDQLEVFVFKIDEKDNRSLGTHPNLGLPLVLDSDITLKVEPRTGRVIDLEEHATTVSIDHPQRGKIPVFISDIEYTQETVNAQIESAKADRVKLVWLGRNVPWTAIGLGIVLALSGAILLLVTTLMRARVRDPESDRAQVLTRLDGIEVNP